MGMSKALMEKVMVARSRSLNNSQTVLCGTRYGNVRATRGSVIPLLVAQVLRGESITVTDGYHIGLSCVSCKLFVAFWVGSNGLPKQRNTPTRSAMFSVLFCYERFIR